MEVGLRLFGPVRWSIEGHDVVVGGAERVAVLLQLVEAEGAMVSIEKLLETVWQERPSSGANAVQRHISALRRQLKEHGVAKPTDLIESVSGGYRLNHINSDLLRLQRLAHGTDEDRRGDRGVRWWEEPLIGAPWEPSQTLRARLEGLAAQALTRWSTHLPVPHKTDLHARVTSMLEHTPGCQAALAAYRVSVPPERDNNRETLTPAGLSALREIVGLWASHRGCEGLDRLEERAASLPNDLARRLARSLIWLDPTEPWAMHILSTLVEHGLANSVQHERSLVTLDARSLEEHPGGREVARAEIDSAATEWELVRALRVAVLVAMSGPHQDETDQLIARLGSIDHPDAQVEAARFRFISALRLGNLHQANDLLDEYRLAATKYWPGAGDDFASMAETVLQRSTDARVVSIFGPSVPRLGAFAADRWAVPFAEAIRRLLVNHPDRPLSDSAYFSAANTVSTTAGTALNLLRCHHAGRPIDTQARLLGARLPELTREKQFLLAPIALSVVAIARRDTDLARAAEQAIEPWSGQMLGLWPADFCFGPADDWLDRLTSLS